jgi:hypothetical protein
MNRETHNPTEFSMLQLLGIQRAMGRGLVEALTPSYFRKIREISRIFSF